jgi:hypothetical protein
MFEQKDNEWMEMLCRYMIQIDTGKLTYEYMDLFMKLKREMISNELMNESKRWDNKIPVLSE